jgi:hypothetical protein
MTAWGSIDAGFTLDRMDAIRAFVHVGIILALSGPISDQAIDALKIETAAIWQPYGVAISWFDANADCAADEQGAPPLVDRIVWLVSDAREGPDPALGNVRFTAGRPEDTIHLRYGRLSRMVLDATVASWPIRMLPPPVRNRLIGQAMGRVVAHELGHLLLALAAHDREGLMRPTFAPDDLVVQGREQMRLSGGYRRRLLEQMTPIITP